MSCFMPIGIVEDSETGRATFTMLRPEDKDQLKPGDSITIRNRLPHLDDITASFQGEITEVGHTIASLVITQTNIPPDWPPHLDPKGKGMPVYLAIPGTYMPDPRRRQASPQELKMLVQLALEHQRATGIAPSGDIIVFTKQEPDFDEDPMNQQE